MEHTFTAPATYTGPVFATITAPTADVRVRVDPTARVASVKVSTTAADDSPAADAVRAAVITQAAGQDLTVHVPEFRQAAVITGSVVQGSATGLTYASGHGAVFVGGVLQASGTTAGVEVLVTLPAGSGLFADTVSGDVRVLGPASHLHAQTVSGDVNVAEAVRMTAVTQSGDVRGGVITERFEAETVSGDVRVTDHAGRSCRIRTVSGDVAVEATPEARGVLTARTVSGDVTLRGTRHLDVEARSLSGDVRR